MEDLLSQASQSRAWKWGMQWVVLLGAVPTAAVHTGPRTELWGQLKFVQGTAGRQEPLPSVLRAQS